MAGAVVCGALVVHLLPIPAALAVLMLSLVLLAVFLSRHRAGSVVFLLLAIVMLSALNAQLALMRQRNGLPAIMEDAGEYMSLRGMVAYEPQCYPHTMEGGGQSCYFDLDLQAVRRAADWVPQSGRVRVRLDLPASEPAPRYGDILQMDGVARIDESARVGFRPARVRFDARFASLCTLERDAGSRLIAFCLSLRQAGSGILKLGISDHQAEAGLLQAILLGYREQLKSDLYAGFRATGTVHIMAISGLHVGLIALVIIFSLRWTGVPRTRWFLVIIPLLTIYTIATGLRASAVRACLMAWIYWLAPPCKRRPDMLSSLALAAILILLADPVQIGDPGFQFSFIIVLGLILAMPRLDALVAEHVRPPAMRIEAEIWPLRFLRGTARYVLLMASVASVAWVVSLPLVMYYGNIVSLVALIGNLIVVPIVTASVALGALCLLLGGALPLAAVFLNQLNLHLLSALLGVVDWLSSLPGGHFYVESPPAVFIPAYYCLLGWLLLARRLWARLAAGGLAALLVLAFILLQAFRSDRVEVRDADGCVTALFSFAGGYDILVNTGPSHCARDMARMLRRHGVDRIELLILSQVDSRHAGGVFNLAEQHRIGSVWIPDYHSRSPVYAELQELARREHMAIQRVSAGEPIEMDKRVEIEIFAPLEGVGYRSSGHAALVFRIARGERAYMLIASEWAATTALDCRKDWAAPVWILEAFPASADLLDRIRLYSPQALVFGGRELPGSHIDSESWMLYDKGAYRADF